MRILCTFPGRHGDLLWALPTVRALSEHYGQPIDLQICGEFAGLVPLLQQQSYLGTITADSAWGISEGWCPLASEGWPGDPVIHLGYRRWPELPLPVEIYDQARSRAEGVTYLPLDLDRPWITVPPATFDVSDFGLVACGWSDCHFELKLGLMTLLAQTLGQAHFLAVMSAPGSRWLTEGREASDWWESEGVDWIEAAQMIVQADCFLGDCSALHVLACALGKPCVLVEPMDARWNPIFFPLGMDGPQVTVVKGLDGRPTYDARHTAETLREVLHAR